LGFERRKKGTATVFIDSEDFEAEKIKKPAGEAGW
jgi:translation elongation factor P/translation initiation factor 5A